MLKYEDEDNLTTCFTNYIAIIMI